MKTSFIALAMLLCGGAVHAQKPVSASTVPGAAKEEWVTLNPNEFHWKVKAALPQKPSPAHGATVWGDPQNGDYALFGKFPAGFTVPLHWHTNELLVVMIQNSMVITPEGGAPREIVQGGFFSLPAKMKYTAHCMEQCVWLGWGEKPFDIVYADPKDDPRNAPKDHDNE